MLGSGEEKQIAGTLEGEMNHFRIVKRALAEKGLTGKGKGWEQKIRMKQLNSQALYKS